ncbi:MAG TPA: hypothetical protein VNN08_24780 [Thermoanaerobaculia bacterium]|nr:hypothetical protein [Thermoanaerobaculia bacterium]
MSIHTVRDLNVDENVLINGLRDLTGEKTLLTDDVRDLTVEEKLLIDGVRDPTAEDKTRNDDDDRAVSIPFYPTTSNFLPTSTIASMGRSRCSRVWAALIWQSRRAAPWERRGNRSWRRRHPRLRITPQCAVPSMRKRSGLLS